MKLLPFATKTDPDRGYSGERCLNLFPRRTDGVSGVTLLGRSGGVSQADVGGPVRAEHRFDGALYAVANGNLVKVVGSAVTTIGAVGSSEDVFFAHNNTQIALLVGNTYYVSDGSTVTSHSTGAISKPVHLSYIDGYIVVIGEGQGRRDLITVSGLDDATTFDALDFASAEDNPDELVAVARDGSRLWMMGTRSTEEWYNAGTADFPLAASGRVIESGCFSARTVAKDDNSVFWLSEDKVPLRTGGGVPEVISTREIDDQLEKSTPHSAFTFKERGHKFYALRRENGTTLVYDITQKQWHERSTGVDDQPWFCVCAEEFAGTYYYGTDTGKIITLDEDTFEDDGAPILAEAISAPVYQADYFRVARLHLQVSGGTDLSRTPRISLETTKDGRNWSSEKWRNLGALGEYSKAAEWHGLGAFRRFQARLRITDAVRRDIHGVSYELAR